MTDEPPDPVVEERAALDRIARTEDGRLLHRYLRRVLESCRADADGGALLRHEGGRIFARDLMAHMAEGIRDSGRSTDTQPLAPAGARAVSVARARGVSRRVGPSTQPLVHPDAKPGSGDAA